MTKTSFTEKYVEESSELVEKESKFNETDTATVIRRSHVRVELAAAGLGQRPSSVVSSEYDQSDQKEPNRTQKATADQISKATPQDGIYRFQQAQVTNYSNDDQNDIQCRSKDVSNARNDQIKKLSQNSQENIKVTFTERSEPNSNSGLDDGKNAVDVKSPDEQPQTTWEQEKIKAERLRMGEIGFLDNNKSKVEERKDVEVEPQKDEGLLNKSEKMAVGVEKVLNSTQNWNGDKSGAIREKSVVCDVKPKPM